MADPKYEGLPGIVYDQPDVFETSDLPESEQSYTEFDAGDNSEAVDILHVSSSEAHRRFKGKVIGSEYIDFSDCISRRPQIGYSTRVEWDVGGLDGDETVVQKYQRLQCEVNHLQQQVYQLKGDVIHCGDKVSAIQLRRQVDELHSTILNMNLEETLGKDIITSISEPEITLQKKLVNLLESFKKTGLVAEKKTEVKGKLVQVNSEAEKGTVLYELYYAPEHAKLNQLARVSQLEQRLDRLESLIGNNAEKLSSLSTWTNHKSLMGAVQVLSSHLALLEPVHLDHIEGRLHSVHTRMNALTEKKEAIEDADKRSKISELYEMTKRCETLSSTIPDIVDRLVSVENLHQEATQFSRSLKQLDVAQTKLNGILETNATLLSGVQERFSKNLETVQKNISTIEKRVLALPKSKT